jgi:hypothetical protein
MKRYRRAVPYFPGTTAQRREGKFLVFMVQLGWTNMRRGRSEESTRRSRNRTVAEYLGTDYHSDEQLTTELVSVFPRLNKNTLRHLLQSVTGISDYYCPWRSATKKFIRSRKKRLVALFEAADRHLSHDKKVSAVITGLFEAGKIDTGRVKITALAGLTPTLACLDPQRVIPIINSRTRPLLRELNVESDPTGILQLSKLPRDRSVRIKNSLELDVYTVTTPWRSGKV